MLFIKALKTIGALAILLWASHVFALGEDLFTELSPPVSRDESVLFVDLNCLLCQSLIKKITDTGKFDDLKLVYVIAVTQEEAIQEKMMWNISESGRYGRSSMGCQIDCSTISTSSTEGTLDKSVNNVDWLQRRVLIGKNTEVLINLFKSTNQMSHVPAVWSNGILTVVDSLTAFKEALNHKPTDKPKTEVSESER